MRPIGTRYFDAHGHAVAVECGQYRMPADWIDTDNRVWAEPCHLYTAAPPGLPPAPPARVAPRPVPD